MRLKRVNPFARECLHEETIVVRSAGMERVVCERCGHISFSFVGDAPGEVAAEPGRPPYR